MNKWNGVIKVTATKDMTNGTPWKLILIFAIPIFLSNLFQQLYNSVDSIIVGNYLSDDIEIIVRQVKANKIIILKYIKIIIFTPFN